MTIKQYIRSRKNELLNDAIHADEKWKLIYHMCYNELDKAEKYLEESCEKKSTTHRTTKAK